MTLTLEQKKITDTFYLALLIWREARGASRPAKIAVAQSVLNRVHHPKWWGRDLSEVATKKWQYSSLAAPGDPQLIIWPLASDASWQEALDVADLVLSGAGPNPAPQADSYFDTSISPPKWATADKFVVQIDNLMFYDLDGSHPENGG